MKNKICYKIASWFLLVALSTTFLPIKYNHVSNAPALRSFAQGWLFVYLIIPQTLLLQRQEFHPDFAMKRIYP